MLSAQRRQITQTSVAQSAGSSAPSSQFTIPSQTRYVGTSKSPSQVSAIAQSGGSSLPSSQSSRPSQNSEASTRRSPSRHKKPTSSQSASSDSSSQSTEPLQRANPTKLLSPSHSTGVVPKHSERQATSGPPGTAPLASGHHESTIDRQLA